MSKISLRIGNKTTRTRDCENTQYCKVSRPHAQSFCSLILNNFYVRIWFSLDTMFCNLSKLIYNSLSLLKQKKHHAVYFRPLTYKPRESEIQRFDCFNLLNLLNCQLINQNHSPTVSTSSTSHLPVTQKNHSLPSTIERSSVHFTSKMTC